jgi:hypothetical protein
LPADELWEAEAGISAHREQFLNISVHQRSSAVS